VFDARTQRWTDLVLTGDAAGPVDCDELTLTTFNIWFNPYFAEQRHRAIAELLSRNRPDVMVFQEVTPAALDIFLAQPWIRAEYRYAAATGGRHGNYGMLMLSRLPINRVTHTPLPTQASRGFLTGEFTVNGRPLAVSAIHLDSGKASARLRRWQLRRIFHALRRSESAVALGDFNMRDSENARISAPYCDLWPALRPNEAGYTEDTSINLMRLDSKDEHRHVRFDRVLLKGSGWAPVSMELLGTEPISAAYPRVFPSDHFGVQCHLRRRVTAPAGSPLRLPFWRRRSGE
jgi:endonuclease/exonuclease/phosphatase family metal-dependent hydrolase